MSNQMNDFIFQQLMTENQKLKTEYESVKKNIKYSEAIKSLVEHVEKKDSEPFNSKFEKSPNQINPYLSKKSPCIIL
jgi:hypothetical protein